MAHHAGAVWNALIFRATDVPQMLAEVNDFSYVRSSERADTNVLAVAALARVSDRHVGTAARPHFCRQVVDGTHEVSVRPKSNCANVRARCLLELLE